MPDFLLTSTFRLAAIFALTFSVAAALLFGFIYWQTALFETGRIDAFIVKNAEMVAAEPRPAMEQAVASRILGDLHRISFAALFATNGSRIAGNLAGVPEGLPADGKAHEVQAVRTEDNTTIVEPVRAVARRLDDGSLLVIGRNIDELKQLRELVTRALALGVIPAFLLSLVAGAFVSRRAQDRVKAVHRSADRILLGDLHERLPTLGTRDDFDRLAGSVNRMLDEISRLLESVKAAGDDIAHDLRTPLARLRTRLERARSAAGSLGELQQTVDSAISDLDETLGLITTLLRIGEIDSARRRSAFQDVDLATILEELAESYGPVAEDKNVDFSVEPSSGLLVHADSGLLLEAVANLVQNAIKFTPPGGHVALSAASSAEGPVITVADTGPGIPPSERERIFDRFYRIDKSRSIEGSGLGLSLVASIVKLHGFRVEVRDAAQGAVFAIICRRDGVMSA
ncbi:MAG TPA: ATP-binding protein [Stellaceae bacterium]|nr:ATP-binding protein [Stellaceae bacterium]